MFADIITGEHGAADVLFLIAVILFLVAVVRAAMVRNWDSLLIASGLAAAALGWLVL